MYKKYGTSRSPPLLSIFSLLLLGTLLHPVFPISRKANSIRKATLSPKAIPLFPVPALAYKPSVGLKGTIFYTLGEDLIIHLKVVAGGSFPWGAKWQAFNPTATRSFVGLFYTANKKTYVFNKFLNGTWKKQKNSAKYEYAGITKVPKYVRSTPENYAILLGVYNNPVPKPPKLYVSWGALPKS